MTDTNEKTGFLQEGPGNASSMRLMCMASLIAAMAYGYFELKAGVPFPNITTMFLVGAFAPKAIQKFAEK